MSRMIHVLVETSFSSEILLWAIWARHSDSQCYCTRRCPMFPKIPSCLPISWIFVGVSLWYRAIEALEAMQSAKPGDVLGESNAWERPNLEKEWSTLYLQPLACPTLHSTSTAMLTWMFFSLHQLENAESQGASTKGIALAHIWCPKFGGGKVVFSKMPAPSSLKIEDYGPPNEVTEVTERVWRSQPF